MAEPIIIGEGGDGGKNRRIVIIAGVAAALILAVVVLPGLLFGGGDDGADDFAFPPPVDVTATTVPGDVPPETFESFSDKNPFTPLIETGGTPVAPPDDPTLVPPTDPVDDPGFGFPDGGPTPTFPEFPTDGEFPSDGETTTTTAPPPPARQPDRVSLLEVYTDPGGQVVASVRVNDITHQVAEGNEFATSYRVLDLDIRSRCAQFLFGDDRFGLCEGDEVLK